MEVTIPLAHASRPLPRVCAVSGEDSETTMRVEAYTTPPWAYATLLLGFVVGILIIYAIRSARPHATLEVPVTKRVRRKIRALSVLAAALLVGGLILLFVAPIASSATAGVAATVALVVGFVVVGLAIRSGVRGKTVRDSIFLRGVHERFAAALIEMPMDVGVTCGRCGQADQVGNFCRSCGAALGP